MIKIKTTLVKTSFQWLKNYNAELKTTTLQLKYNCLSLVFNKLQSRLKTAQAHKKHTKHKRRKKMGKKMVKAMRTSNQKYTKEGMTQTTFVISKADMCRFKIACIVVENKKIAEVLRELVKEYTERVFNNYKKENGGEMDFNDLLKM